MAKLVPMHELRPASWNPRAIERSNFQRLVRSTERDPGLMWGRPILAMRDGTIYAGNMRYEAVAQLGPEWRVNQFGSDGIPTIFEDLTVEMAKERAMRDNSQWGEWVEQDLAEILTELAARGVDIEILGFSHDEIERLLALVSAATPGDDDFDPTPPSIPQTRPGDVLILGPHRLVCGDSREPSTWDLLLVEAGESAVLADALWTDPPYGVDLAGVALPSRGHPEDLVLEGDLPEEVAPLLASVFRHADHWLRPGAPFYIAGPHGRMAVPFVQEISRVGWHLAQALVWVKNSFVPGRADYHHQHEAIYYGWRPGAAHTWLHAVDQATLIDDEPDPRNMTRPELIALVKELRANRGTDVLREDKTRQNDLHPTMKPTALIRRMLGNSTRRGDLVLDPFAGSGSTIIAAQLMGRRAAAIELEPRFCDVIARRWLAFEPTNTALRVRDGQPTTIGTNG